MRRESNGGGVGAPCELRRYMAGNIDEEGRFYPGREEAPPGWAGVGWLGGLYVYGQLTTAQAETLLHLARLAGYGVRARLRGRLVEEGVLSP
jgi:hypothetical protein